MSGSDLEQLGVKQPRDQLQILSYSRPMNTQDHPTERIRPAGGSIAIKVFGTSIQEPSRPLEGSYVFNKTSRNESARGNVTSQTITDFFNSNKTFRRGCITDFFGSDSNKSKENVNPASTNEQLPRKPLGSKALANQINQKRPTKPDSTKTTLR